MMNRLPSDHEQTLVTKVAAKLDDEERDRLLDDLRHARVSGVSADGSMVSFRLAGYERPPYNGQHTYGFEGKMSDAGGAELGVLLFADENGRLLELEIIRWGEGDLIAPDWSALEVL